MIITNKNALNIQTLDRNLTNGCARKVDNIVDTVEDRIQNDISAAVKNISTSRTELAVRSKNASLRQGAASVVA